MRSGRSSTGSFRSRRWSRRTCSRRGRSTGSDASPAELAEALVGLGAPAALVTGGHGEESADHLFDGTEHHEIPFERRDVAATHGAGCTHSATLAALLARGLSLLDAARGAAAAASQRGRAGTRRDRRRRRAGRRAGSRGAMSVSPGSDAARAARAEAARPPDHELRRHERDGQRDARARRAAGDGARPGGGRGDGRLRVGARPQHRHALGALDRGDADRGRRRERARDPGRARSGRRRRDRPTARTRRGGSSTRCA